MPNNILFKDELVTVQLSELAEAGKEGDVAASLFGVALRCTKQFSELLQPQHRSAWFRAVRVSVNELLTRAEQGA